MAACHLLPRGLREREQGEPEAQQLQRQVQASPELLQQVPQSLQAAGGSPALEESFRAAGLRNWRPPEVPAAAPSAGH